MLTDPTLDDVIYPTLDDIEQADSGPQSYQQGGFMSSGMPAPKQASGIPDQTYPDGPINPMARTGIPNSFNPVVPPVGFDLSLPAPKPKRATRGELQDQMDAIRNQTSLHEDDQGDLVRDLPDTPGWVSAFDKDPLNEAVNAILQVGQSSFGHALKGIQALALGLPSGAGIEGAPITNEDIALQKQRDAMSPEQLRQERTQMPLYVAGQALEQTAAETHPTLDPDSAAVGVGNAIGSFLPAALTGPAAPFIFALQAAGGTLDSSYDEAIASGKTPDEAAAIATKKALAEGTYQGLLMKFFPKQANKLGEAGMEKLFGNVIKEQLLDKAARIGARQGFQAVEGSAFGALSQIGSNVIQGRDVTQGVGESALGMGIIQGLTPHAAGRGEIERHNKAITEQHAELTRSSLAHEREQAKNEIIKEEGPVTQEDRDELHDLDAAQKKGLNLTSVQKTRLESLRIKTAENEVLPAEHQQTLEKAAAGENRTVSYADLGEGAVAKPDGKGGIVVDKLELAHALAQLETPKERADLVNRIVNEESVHNETTKEQASRYYEAASAAERRLAHERYYGTNEAGKRVDRNSEAYKNNLGHEMIRARIQKMQGLSPTEIAYKTGMNIQAINGMENAIWNIKKLYNKAKNYSGRTEQVQILDSVMAKLEEARKIKMQVEVRPNDLPGPKVENEANRRIVDENQPFSQRPASRSPQGITDYEAASELKPEEFNAFLKSNKRGATDAGYDLGAQAAPADIERFKQLEKKAASEVASAVKSLGESPKEKQADAFATAQYANLKKQYFNEAIRMHDAVADVEKGLDPSEVAKRLGVDQPSLEKWVKRRQAEENYSVRQNKKIEDEHTDRESKALGIRVLPDPGPASRRPGESKADELRRMAEEIRLRKLEAAGVEVPAEHKTQMGMKGGKVEEPTAVNPADRVSAESAGALPSVTGRDLEKKAESILWGKVGEPAAKETTMAQLEGRLQARAARRLKTAKTPEDRQKIQDDLKPDNVKRIYDALQQRRSQTKYSLLKFKDFADWGARNSGAKPAELRQVWEDRVWNHLVNAPGERLSQLRKELDLESKYGRRPIVDAQAPGNPISVEGVNSALTRNAIRAKEEANQRYRNKVFSAVAQKLIAQSLEGRPEITRSEVSIDDLDFSNPDHGAYQEIRKDDLSDPERLKKIFRAGARGSSSDPESASRRVVAVVDSAGHVTLLSTYNDAGVQRITDPSGTALKIKPNRELNQTFLNQYRPFATMLLSDPVKGLRQKFESVSEFMDKMGREANERSTIGSYEHILEGPADPNFEAEGTVTEGEGGGFMGPGRGMVPTTSRNPALTKPGPMMPAEAKALVKFVTPGERELTHEDVLAAVTRLKNLAETKKLSPRDLLAANALRKMFNKMGQQEGYEFESTKQRLNRMAHVIVDADLSPRTDVELLKEFGQKTRPEVEVRKSGSGEELTKRGDIRPPTSQNVFAGPFQRVEPPSSEVGGLSNPKPYIPESVSVPDRPEDRAARLNRASEITKRSYAKKGTILNIDQAGKIAGMTPEEIQKAKDLGYTKPTETPAQRVARAKKMQDKIEAKSGVRLSFENAAHISDLSEGPLSIRPGQVRDGYYRKWDERPIMPKEVRDTLLNWWKNTKVTKEERGGLAAEIAKDEQKTPGTMAYQYEMAKESAGKQSLVNDLDDSIFNLASMPSSEWGMSNRQRAQVLKWFSDNKNIAHNRESLARQYLSAFPEIQGEYQSQIQRRMEFLNSEEARMKEEAKKVSEGDWQENRESKYIRDWISRAKNEIEFYRNELKKNRAEEKNVEDHLANLEKGYDGHKPITDILDAEENRNRLARGMSEKLLRDVDSKPPPPDESPSRGDDPNQGMLPLSIRPGAKEALDKFKEFARSPSLPAPEALMIDVDSPIPRFTPNVDTALTRAMGLEKVPILGRLMGPRAKVRDNVDRAIIGYSVKRVIGNSQAALIGAKLNALNKELGTPFKQDPNGKILNVNADPKQSLFPSDLFEDWQRQQVIPEKMRATIEVNAYGKLVPVYSPKEISDYVKKNPETFGLTPNQTKMFQEMYRHIEDGYQYLNEKNAKMEEAISNRNDQMTMPGLGHGLEIYPLPRVALYKRSVGPVASEVVRRVGGAYQIEKDRLYDTEAEGQPSTAYEPDMTKRMVAFTNRVYKAVADADLAGNPELKGQTPEQRAISLAKEYEADYRAGRKTERDILRMSYQPRLGIEGQVHGHAAFADKVFPIDVANKLNRAFGSQQNRFVNAVSEISTMTKAFMLTGDLAQYLQQGALMMFRRPGAWANAVSKSLRSLADPTVTGKYLQTQENYEAATEFAQAGGSLGHLQDFMSGSRPGEFANRIPGVNKLITASGRAFGTFFDISKIEMWKALREVTPKEQWPRMVEQIDNMVLSGKMEAAGLSPGRSQVERILFMAPSYYRGALQLVAGLASRDAVGNETRKVLGSYAAGLMATMVGSYLASGMSWEEIRKRLTPGQANSKFLAYPVKINGVTHEIGPGGIVLQLLSLGVDMGMTAATKPKDLVSWGDKNPLIKFISSKLGPIPALAAEIKTGKDAVGRPSSPLQAITRLGLPVSAQGPLQRLAGIASGGKSDLLGDAVSSTAGFVGLRSRTSSPGTDMANLAAKFMENNKLKKETGWELSQVEGPSYSKLRAAAISGVGSEFRKAYTELRETHNPKEIEAALKTWAKQGFTGSAKHEGRFRASLSDEERNTYNEAINEKHQTFLKFLRMRAAM